MYSNRPHIVLGLVNTYIIRDYSIHECVDHLKNDLGSCWLLLGYYLLYISDWNLFAVLVIALTFKWVFSYEKIHSFYVVLSQIILIQNNQATGGIMLILCSFSDCTLLVIEDLINIKLLTGNYKT